MLIVNRDNKVIGRYTRPVTTSVVFVQLGVHRNLLFGDHPEAVQNAEQIQMLRIERIDIFDIQVLRINDDIPKDLFQHPGFDQWNG